MIDIEKRARHLLAAAMRDGGFQKLSNQILMRDEVQEHNHRFALNAIIAALTPPEGYVLVPVEPTEAMVAEAWKYGYADDAPDPVYSYRAMLAARPEVK